MPGAGGQPQAGGGVAVGAAGIAPPAAPGAHLVMVVPPPPMAMGQPLPPAPQQYGNGGAGNVDHRDAFNAITIAVLPEEKKKFKVSVSFDR